MLVRHKPEARRAVENAGQKIGTSFSYAANKIESLFPFAGVRPFASRYAPNSRRISRELSGRGYSESITLGRSSQMRSSSSSMNVS